MERKSSTTSVGNDGTIVFILEILTSCLNVSQDYKICGINRMLESMKQNAGKPGEKSFGEFFEERGIPERE